MDIRPRVRDLKGWLLRRRGGRITTWSRRWCVLKDKILFIFLKEDDTKPQEIIDLEKQMVVEPPVDPSDTRQGYFDIVTPSDNDKNSTETLSLCAESDDLKKTWIRALRRALYADKGGALFSQSLEEILFWEKQAGRRVPYIVDECVEYLYKYGLEVEGIFRLPGRQAVIKDVIARFEQGQKMNFEEDCTDVHVVASVLKTFLRDLPDSIIPCEFFQKFMNIALRFMEGQENTVKEKCVEELTEAMKLIPEDNYVILKYVCSFLREVGLNEPKNKMSMLSLGTVFGYNIIRHIDKENSQLFLCTADLGQNLVFMLLQYFPKIFVLEYNDHGEVIKNVPTADLLRISRDLDVPLVPPHAASSKHMKDLEGLDLTSAPWEENENSEKVRNCSQLQPKPRKKRMDVSDKSVVSASMSDGNSAEKKMLYLSLSVPGKVENRLSSSSPDLNSDLGPVPPTRKKILRNRHQSDRRRPVPIVEVDNVPRSPMTPESVNADDVLTALANANINSDSSSSSPGSTLPRDCSHPDSDATSSSSPRDATSSGDMDKVGREGDGKVKPTYEEMLIKEQALKEELLRQREKNKEQIRALQAQLSNMREKYDRRIETMKAEHESQKQDLEHKLEVEKEARETAVAYTIELKEEIHKYQMQYGELTT